MKGSVGMPKLVPSGQPLPSPALPPPLSRVTGELSEQLGVRDACQQGDRVSAPSSSSSPPRSLHPSRQPRQPAAGHQLIIASAAVKEAHFGSDRLMTCETRWY